MYFPENFIGLAASVQAEIFKSLLCPVMENILAEASILVCSSQFPEDIKPSPPGFSPLAIYFTLEHSTLSTYLV